MNFPLIPRTIPVNQGGYCPVCGVALSDNPLPSEGSFRFTALVGTFERPYAVHGDCLGPMNYFRWSQIQAYQHWKMTRALVA